MSPIRDYQDFKKTCLLCAVSLVLHEVFKSVFFSHLTHLLRHYNVTVKLKPYEVVKVFCRFVVYHFKDLR